MNEKTQRALLADFAHCWHPFTPQDAWTTPGHKPVVIESGQGVWLTDTEGRRYIDGNSSIWTNIHGHGHPRIVAAIQDQAARIAHSSFLGYTHPLAGDLAERLCSFFPGSDLTRVFFSDNGSTAIEAALKMSLQSRQQTGEGKRIGIIAFDNAYHGDTLGAASMGGVERFFKRFEGLGLPVTRVGDMDALKALPPAALHSVSALIIEPLIQGVNQMTPWPQGMLRQLADFCRELGIHLILDEVMTGFGRTGSMFACQQEGVVPDFLCLAKGLTGGTVPLAATLTTRAIYESFSGSAENAFYYGHSYTANPIGCAAALASLDVFEEESTLETLPGKVAHFHNLLQSTGQPFRQCGLIAGLDVPDAPATITHLRQHQVLTRPILNTIVLMPPLSITKDELTTLLTPLRSAR